MTSRSDQTKALVELAHERFPAVDAPVVEGLLRTFYAGVSHDDLEGRDVLDLYGAAVSHWQLARVRPAGTDEVRVYNPASGEDGWQSSHTVIDIVTDDAPFLVDSVMTAVEQAGLRVHLLAHPVLDVGRDDGGALTSVAGHGAASTSTAPESFIHLEVDHLDDPEALAALGQRLRRGLGDVRAAVRDWESMRRRAVEVAAELREPAPSVDPAERDEAAALLEFLAGDHFTFLGYRRFDVTPDAVTPVEGSGLGVVADTATGELVDAVAVGPADGARPPAAITLTKADATSTVHRGDRLDYLGVSIFDDDGAVVGEHRFVGLYTSSLYAMSVTQVPVLRRKVAEVLARIGNVASSHDRASLLSILEDYPRDELFDSDVDDLVPIVEGVLHLQIRRRVRLFVRHDRFGRYVSCLVFVPRDRYNTEVRRGIQRLLLDAFDATDCEFDSQVGGEPMARVHVTVFAGADRQVRIDGDLDLDELEDDITALATAWEDRLRDALIDHHGEAHGLELFDRYGTAFGPAYRADHRAAVAVADIDRLVEVAGTDALSVNLYRPLESRADSLRVKLFRAGEPITLSAVVPLLHDLGATVTDERPYEIRALDEPAWIYDFGLTLPLGGDVHRDRGSTFEAAFLAAWQRRTDSDGFHHLVMTTGLGWRQLSVVRAYRHYLRQIGSTFSQAYYEDTLRAHPDLACLLVGLFEARFDPDRAPGRAEAVEAVRAELAEALELVPTLDEDRMLRSFVTLIEATVRTNYYAVDDAGSPPDQLAFKLDPTMIEGLPRPVPAHEIFVYGPHVEGVHLRAGRVARGGLRWSDRREDFRTEVLGLMKAQTVKNSVIVPVGAKGGFVAKRITKFMDRAEVRAEVEAAYRAFVSGLLDVTDNLVNGEVRHPERVVCHDGDDPYLVVAADRGTATLSDVANEIAVARGFWLGDAFASGGSEGYDHKEMGITARGAWESVKQHFRELGVDPELDPVTVVGIGDMSGDVFGNGMLQSSSLRLVGAFDHRHVFIDPDPDPAVSFAERRRLFDLPGSSWDDYDRAAISDGGGVFDRSTKSIPVSAPMAAALGLDGVDELAPNQLVSALLRAPVDLLWNGGIGTFVKASSETHAAAGDRNNDLVRVDATELRCAVVGEGGNLGLTQLARVDFAASGGRVFSDAVDNSAGVNCSDHEVNIKILLNDVVAAGDLTVKQRNELLADMTAEVAALVLASNENQTTALSAARAQAPGMVGVHQRHLRWLERVAGLDRELEALPTDHQLNERREAGRGLTAPELAVLMAYTKIALADDFVASDLPDDPQCRDALVEYFPTPLRDRYKARIQQHPLARELVATIITNRLVDRAGLSMPQRLAEETSAPMADIARAHIAAWRLFDLESAWDDVEALPRDVPAIIQVQMQLEIKRLGERTTRWLLRHRSLPLDIGGVLDRYRDDVAEVVGTISGLLSGRDRAAFDATIAQVSHESVPAGLAEKVAGMGLLISALDVADVARRTGSPVALAAATYFELNDVLGLGWFRDRIIALPRDERWESLARSALRDDFFAAHGQLTASVLAPSSGEPDATSLIDAWLRDRRAVVAHCTSVLSDIRASGRPDLAELSVGLRELRNLIHVAGREARVAD